MTPQEHAELNLWIHKHVFEADLYVGLKKRGAWYRPDAKGYTDKQSEAGRYTRAEAAEHEYPRKGSNIKLGKWDEPVTIHEFQPEDYTTDPAAAMEVLKKCVEHLGYGKPIEITQDSDGGFVISHVDYFESEAESKCVTEADTLTILISLFAKQLFSK